MQPEVHYYTMCINDTINESIYVMNGGPACVLHSPKYRVHEWLNAKHSSHGQFFEHSLSKSIETDRTSINSSDDDIFLS
jgi:hypothetical protein